VVRAGAVPAGAGVVELTWEDPSGARLRCYLPSAGRWIDRSVRFSADDPPAERGRTLGFVVASIFVEAPPRKKQPPPPAADDGVKRDVPAPLEPVRMGASAAVVAAGPGDGTSFGAQVVLDYRLLPSFRVGLAGEGRFGTLPPAQASLRVLSGGVTITWEAFRPSSHDWLGVTLGVSGAELRVTYLASGRPAPESLSRLVLLAQPMLSGGVGIGGSASGFFAAGVELHGGRTVVEVGREERAVIGLVLPAGRIGLRTDF
jgi:hypothetical protein